MTTPTSDIVRAGAPIGAARAAVVLVHGRGASAEGMLSLADALAARDVAYVAPQAPGHSWYPYSFLAPIAQNEPYLTNALNTISGVVGELGAQGVADERIVLLGFSQGACLALEYAARNARRFGGIVGFSGGLIGPEGMPRDHSGSLAGTPVFLGCSDIDSHIPLARVHESAEVLRKLGGQVSEQIYPGMGHTIIQDEIVHAQKILAAIPVRESG
jgi:phospholipase/carboxylesterase